MATGRIGVTPTLRTRWSDQPTAGTTSLSGLDDNSVSLVYDVGYEAVYRNGVLLSRGNDYTATNGTTVTLTDATIAGDIIEIFANQLVPLTDAISKGQYTAKGALLSATAASTPGVLAVGANDTVLTADSTTSTGLKWATAGGGKLLQVVTATYATEASTSSSTYIDSGLTATITPTSATSTILVLVNQQIGLTATTGVGIHLQGRIVRGATNVYDFEAQFQAQAVSSILRYRNNDTFIYRDSPATTSATTYKTTFRSADSGTVFTQPENRMSTITLMEIGA